MPATGLLPGLLGFFYAVRLTVFAFASNVGLATGGSLAPKLRLANLNWPTADLGNAALSAFFRHRFTNNRESFEIVGPYTHAHTTAESGISDGGSGGGGAALSEFSSTKEALAALSGEVQQEPGPPILLGSSNLGSSNSGGSFHRNLQEKRKLGADPDDHHTPDLITECWNRTEIPCDRTQGTRWLETGATGRTHLYAPKYLWEAYPGAGVGSGGVKHLQRIDCYFDETEAPPDLEVLGSVRMWEDYKILKEFFSTVGVTKNREVANASGSGVTIESERHDGSHLVERIKAFSSVGEHNEAILLRLRLRKPFIFLHWTPDTLTSHRDYYQIACLTCEQGEDDAPMEGLPPRDSGVSSETVARKVFSTRENIDGDARNGAEQDCWGGREIL